MAETLSGSSQKKAKVDDLELRDLGQNVSHPGKKNRLVLSLFLVHSLNSDVRCVTKFAAVLIK